MVLARSQVGGELVNPNNGGAIRLCCWASCLSANLRKPAIAIIFIIYLFQLESVLIIHWQVHRWGLAGRVRHERLWRGWIG